MKLKITPNDLELFIPHDGIISIKNNLELALIHHLDGSKGASLSINETTKIINIILDGIHTNNGTIYSY